MTRSREKLKNIRFEGELLPDWAQLLDTAALMCPVSQGTRAWFSRLTNAAGTDDARIALAEAETLRAAIAACKESIISELEEIRGPEQGERIFAAWEYSLDTIIQQAAGKRTCSWKLDGVAESAHPDYGDGDIRLRRA
jgi:hypothetical protein